MLVDNPLHQPYFNPVSYQDYQTDLSDIFHTELFASSSSTTNSSNPQLPTASPSSGASNSIASPGATSASSASISRASSPQSPFQALLTPPQPNLPSSFPDIHTQDTGNFFSFLDEDLKVADPMSMSNSATYDFFGGSNGLNMSMSHPSLDLSMLTIDMNLSNHLVSGEHAVMGIDPQLVDTPAESQMSDIDEEDEESQHDSQQQDLHHMQPELIVTPPPEDKEKAPERLTLTITPAKVNSTFKSRRGAVHSGGVSKRSSSASIPSSLLSSATISTASSPSSSAASPKDGSLPPLSTARKVTSILSKTRAPDDDDDDDLPADWRPSPEVYAKMSSKEKRQLRNKISARNFRVRRKGPSLMTSFVSNQLTNPPLHSLVCFLFCSFQSTYPHLRVILPSATVCSMSFAQNSVLQRMRIALSAKRLLRSRRPFSRVATAQMNCLCSTFPLPLLYPLRAPQKRSRPQLPTTTTTVQAIHLPAMVF